MPILSGSGGGSTGGGRGRGTGGGSGAGGGGVTSGGGGGAQPLASRSPAAASPAARQLLASCLSAACSHDSLARCLALQLPADGGSCSPATRQLLASRSTAARLGRSPAARQPLASCSPVVGQPLARHLPAPLAISPQLASHSPASCLPAARQPLSARQPLARRSPAPRQVQSCVLLILPSSPQCVVIRGGRMPPPIAPAFARTVPVSEPVGWKISRSCVKVVRVKSSSPAAWQPLASSHPPPLSAFVRSLGMWAVRIWGPSVPPP